MMSSLHKLWLVNAGATLQGKGLCEVSAELSYNGEGLRALVEGRTYRLPLLLSSAAECEEKDVGSSGDGERMNGSCGGSSLAKSLKRSPGVAIAVAALAAVGALFMMKMQKKRSR